MANPSLQIGNDNWAIKEDNLLGYSTAGTRFVPQPITMTRATSGTRVNPSGLVEDVELLGSEEVTNGDFGTDSDWNKTGTWSIESNYATANGNSTSQYIQQDFTITNGKTYLFTYEVIENTLNGNGASLSGSGGFVSVSLSSVIGTHQVYITADDSGAVYALKIGVSGTATTGTIKLDNVSVKESTKNNLARVDYTDGTSSLLAEPQRTNLIQYSEDFSNAYWTKTNSTVTANITTSPDGILSADKLVENSLNGSHFIIPANNSFVLGNAYTLTVFAKASERNHLLLRFGSAAFPSSDRDAWFNLTDGTIGAKGVTVKASIVELSNSWYRLSITQTADASNSTTVVLVLGDGETETYQGNGTSGLYIWGAQTEVGSYPTSLIPTSGSTVTRNQDIFTRDGIGSLINSTEGTIFVEMAALANDSTNRYISINDGSSTNRIIFKFGTSSNNISALGLGTATSFSLSYSSATITNMNKIALKYKVNDCALWVNGVEVATDTTFTAYTANTLNQINFSNYAGSGVFLDAKVKQLQVFKTALSDSELATLTT